MSKANTTNPAELWKKAFLMGVGATAVTVEKAQGFVNDLVKKGELTQKEASSITTDLKKRAVKEKEQLEKHVKTTVESTLKAAIQSMGLVTRTEYDKLKSELTRLKGTDTKKAAVTKTATAPAKPKPKTSGKPKPKPKTSKPGAKKVTASAKPTAVKKTTGTTKTASKKR